MKSLNKVLIIDDSVSTQKLTKRIIEGMGISNEITTTGNGKEALQYLKGSGDNFPCPELILLDLNMPDSDGFDFLKEYVQLDPKYTNQFEIVIAVVSDFLDGDNFEKIKYYKNYGVTGHIPKPLLEDDLLEFLDEEDFTLS